RREQPGGAVRKVVQFAERQHPVPVLAERDHEDLIGTLVAQLAQPPGRREAAGRRSMVRSCARPLTHLDTPERYDWLLSCSMYAAAKCAISLRIPSTAVRLSPSSTAVTIRWCSLASSSRSIPSTVASR